MGAKIVIFTGQWTGGSRQEVRNVPIRAGTSNFCRTLRDLQEFFKSTKHQIPKGSFPARITNPRRLKSFDFQVERSRDLLFQKKIANLLQLPDEDRFATRIKNQDLGIDKFQQVVFWHGL